MRACGGICSRDNKEWEWEGGMDGKKIDDRTIRIGEPQKPLGGVVVGGGGRLRAERRSENRTTGRVSADLCLYYLRHSWV